MCLCFVFICSLDVIIFLLCTLLKGSCIGCCIGCCSIGCCLTMAAALAAAALADEQQGEAEDARVTADPSIGISDLETALDLYFKDMHYRNLEQVLQLIKDGKVTWKTAPKAMAWDLV